jgi:hypothetical protein
LPLGAVHLNTLPVITGRNAGATDRGFGRSIRVGRIRAILPQRRANPHG